MAWHEMKVAPIRQGNTEVVAYEYEDNLSAIGNGDAILIPKGINWFSTTMSFTAGATGKIQVTTDTVATVKSETGVTWVDSWWGDADDIYVDLFFPVTAIRIVQIDTGTMKLTVRAQ